MKQPKAKDKQKRSADYDAYYSSYDGPYKCSQMDRPECDEECPEYDEFDETCDEKALNSVTDALVQTRIINGAKYTAGTTPWLVALDYDESGRKT